MKTYSKCCAATAVLLFSLFASSTIAQIGDPDEQPKADSRVRKALEQASLKYTIDSDGDFKLSFSLNDDRTHLVFINSNTEVYDNMEVREIWACGAVSEDGFSRQKLESLLKMNQKYKMGSWSLTPDGERAIFTVVVSARANSDTIDSMVRLVAKTADNLEKEWLGNDEL